MTVELINGRTPEKILFNIRECAYGACLSECPYDSSDECMEDLLKDALALINLLESERDAALASLFRTRRAMDGNPTAQDAFETAMWDAAQAEEITLNALRDEFYVERYKEKEGYQLARDQAIKRHIRRMKEGFD